MRRTHLIAALLCMIALGALAADASAMYHPTMGRFLQRDPGAGHVNRIGAGGAAQLGGFIPRDPTGSNQYADGMNLYQYVGSNPIGYVDPTGLSGQSLSRAAKMFLNRVLGVKMGPHYAGAHPKTGGVMPLAGGILWGLSAAYRDSGQELTPELIAKRTAEFGAAPAVTYSAMAYYFATGSKTALAIAKAGGVMSRASLYGAAFYVGYQIGDKAIMNPLRDLRNEAWFYKNKAALLRLVRSKGELLAVDVLKGAPKICCAGKPMQLGPTTPETCARKMIRYFGLASYGYGYFAWGDKLGDRYEDFKAKKGKLGDEDPKHFKTLLSSYEDAIKKYVECVSKKCGGKIRPYPQRK